MFTQHVLGTVPDALTLR